MALKFCISLMLAFCIKVNFMERIKENPRILAFSPSFNKTISNILGCVKAISGCILAAFPVSDSLMEYTLSQILISFTAL